MSAVIFTSINEFVNSASFTNRTDLYKDRITKIDLVIDALLTNVLEAAGTNNIEEFQLNDGQTIIKTIYNGADDVFKSITVAEKLRTYYQNQITGHTFRMIDHKSIHHGRG